MNVRFGRVPSAYVVMLFLFTVCIVPLPSRATTPPAGRVVGTVRSADGVPIADARITLRASGRRASARSDAHGRFAIARLAPGTYDVTAVAAGFSRLSERTVAIGGATTVLTLRLATVSTGALAVIGSVTSSAGATVSSASGPSATLDAQRAAAAGTTAVAAMLRPLLSTTAVLPLGGGSNAVVSYAVRGPDPSETLVDLDGHPVNNGNTGDFDLSLIDPAALASVQVIYGIAPSSLLGPDTLGGAIDLVTLEPTATERSLVRGFVGSYGSTGATVQSTGSSGRIGYVLSLHRATSLGSVNGNVRDSDGVVQSVGSGSFGESLLSKLRYRLGGSGYGYVQLDLRDQASNRDLSALLTTLTPAGFGDAGGYQAFPGTAMAARQAGYGLDGFVPLGASDAGTPTTTLTFSHLTSLAAQSVSGPGAQTSPYLYDQRDDVVDDWLRLDHQFARGQLSFKVDLSNEALRTQYVPGSSHADVVVRAALPGTPGASGTTTVPLAQTQRSAVLRYEGDPSSYLHYSLATYLSDFSVFGTHVDPRAGVVWTPNAASAVRFSVGSTFQAPQLTSLYVPPSLPPPAGGVISIGNPNLRPDFATEYDLGAEQIFGRLGHQTSLAIDLYRNNLRQPTSTLVPTPVPDCAAHGDCPLSYPINAGDGVYTGVDLKLDRSLGPADHLRLGWDVDSSYLTAVPPDVQDGTLVIGEQSLGQPLHKGYVGYAHDVPLGTFYGVELDYEGAYNELNRGPYATLGAHLGYRTKHLEIGLYGTNLTNADANAFTVIGGGVPYGALPGGPMIATDAYTLAGTSITLVVTARR